MQSNVFFYKILNLKLDISLRFLSAERELKLVSSRPASECCRFSLTISRRTLRVLRLVGPPTLSVFLSLSLSLLASALSFPSSFLALALLLFARSLSALVPSLSVLGSSLSALGSSLSALGFSARFPFLCLSAFSTSHMRVLEIARTLSRISLRLYQKKGLVRIFV